MEKKLKFACQTMSWKKVVEEDPELVMHSVRDAGYEGIEFAPIQSLEHLRDMALMAARHGLKLLNVHPPSGGSFLSVDYNAILGNESVEIKPCWRWDFGGRNPTMAAFRAAAARLEKTVHYVKAHGLKPFCHVHLDTMMETEEDMERLLSCSPDLYALLDTGHLCAAKGDPVQAIKRFGSRIAHVHLKDFYAEDHENWDRHAPGLWQTARFAEIGKGNCGLDVKGVLDALLEMDYRGWVSVELDHPQRPEPAHCRGSLKHVRSLGF
ncbi:MAG: TIM barrel protein [Armatimonadetes bacterium]|nr:TIM barrel protein [Armatimonadota bacterium]